MATFDRYTKFRENGSYSIVPFGEIPVKSTDRYETYMKGRTRLDQLSYQYYDDPNYAWLIMQANPSYGSMEFDIPDMVELRIPYPLQTTLQDYQESLDKHKKYYN